MDNNQSSLQKSIGILLVIALIIIGGYYFYNRSKATVETASPTPTTSTTTSAVPDGGTGTTGGSIGSDNTLPANFSSYANSEYGFKMGFPSYARQENGFTTFNNLGTNWRVNAAAANQGKAVVSFPIFRVDQGTVPKGKDYPLYFTSEVRVGVSPNVKECYSTDPGYTTQASTNVTINGVTFKKFVFGDAGMMKYIQGNSYRTVHNNMCYVIEQIKAGSSYRDDTMKAGLSDQVLQGYYDAGLSVVNTFRFTK